MTFFYKQLSTIGSSVSKSEQNDVSQWTGTVRGDSLYQE